MKSGKALSIRSQAWEPRPCPKRSWKGRSTLTCTRSYTSSLAGSSAGSRLICQMNMTGSSLGPARLRRFWKLSRSSGPIPGSSLNIPGQEMFTATGLISWSKPAIKLTKKIPTEGKQIFSGYFFVIVFISSLAQFLVPLKSRVNCADGRVAETILLQFNDAGNG